MKLHEKLKQIEALEAVNTPWHVKRTFGVLTVFGTNVCVHGDVLNDYVTMQEFRDALTWLVDQAGGRVTWPKGK